ncbi:MAG: phosphoribosyltransferase [Planctomycetes bacterium]|nr:phosphoribosyltransferase [Planctomycetota bacterium]
MTLSRFAFTDRYAAGQALGSVLRRACLLDPLVLGIPRGGVPVAAVVAHAIGGELDVVVSEKLSAMNAPDLALGAVAADGTVCWNAEVLAALGSSPSQFALERELRSREAAARACGLRAGLPARSLAGRDVVVVVDGIATGATLRAALRSVARAHPARLVAAAPVGSPDACRALRLEFPELLCLHEPEPFFSVGACYTRFPEVEDEEVVRLLRAQLPRLALKN